MDFAVIGRISSFVKTKNLMFAANYKIKTGQTLTNANGNLVSTSSTTFDKLRDAVKTGQDKAKRAKLLRIKQKLLNGKKLSDEELGFLRVNDPKLYKKAKAVEEAREELKDDLKKAKSKDEAREAMTRAMVKASTTAMSELSAIGGGSSAMQTGGGANMQIGGDTGAINFSGGDMSTFSNGAASQAFTDINPSQDCNKMSAEQNPAAQASSADETNTPEDVMEKYLMIIRALEDEWAQFTNSKEYKDLPEHTVDEVTTIENKKNRQRIDAPNRKVLEAANLYRKAMTYYND